MNTVSPCSSFITSSDKRDKGRLTARLLAQVAGEDSGTFKQSLRAPIHRWYSYPVGFSHTVVESAIRLLGLQPGAVLYDPFAGTATSLLAARSQGLVSHGLEAHPFIHFVGATKLQCDYDIERALESHVTLLAKLANGSDDLDNHVAERVPELIKKCFTTPILQQLISIRDELYALSSSERAYRDLGLLALASILRRCAAVSTRWPYIRPKTRKAVVIHDAVRIFDAQVRSMLLDIKSVGSVGVSKPPEARLICSDARIPHPYLRPNSVDLVFSSPPYLNNFDYADRTRLETYFLGQFSTWKEITAGVRNNLVVAATTQVCRATHDPRQLLAPLASVDKHLHDEVSETVAAIAAQRVGPGTRRRKNFDIMVAGYVADMLSVLTNTSALIRPGGHAVLILGDSRLYGVHVPTDKWICRLAMATGFKSYDIAMLRQRGTKWPKQDLAGPVGELSESLILLRR